MTLLSQMHAAERQVDPKAADVAGTLYPCAGVYAVAEATGTIRRDDRVSLI